MKTLKAALIAACAVCSTSTTASMLETRSNDDNSKVSTCYYEYTVIYARRDI